jgi:hypothetical protein
MIGPVVEKKWCDETVQNKKKQELKESIENMGSLGTLLAKRYSKIFDKYKNL